MKMALCDGFDVAGDINGQKGATAADAKLKMTAVNFSQDSHSIIW